MLPQQVVEAVTAEWCIVLEVETVATADDFFMLGGDSMRALELVNRVGDRLGIKFPLEALFLDGTFGAVVEACNEAANS